MVGGSKFWLQEEGNTRTTKLRETENLKPFTGAAVTSMEASGVSGEVTHKSL